MQVFTKQYYTSLRTTALCCVIYGPVFQLYCIRMSTIDCYCIKQPWFVDCGVNCHLKCKKFLPSLCGLDEKLFTLRKAKTNVELHVGLNNSQDSGCIAQVSEHVKAMFFRRTLIIFIILSHVSILLIFTFLLIVGNGK